ncbi:ketopantoate reductase family protein [Rhizobium grahamii]|uniref:2-dehydropantoate 2-reductase n=1 Tax=Rhizobium grahamii CCGE 502 TaxID=990285 RepID=S3I3U7_9HYPH|nr:2-dehydropantoate 2-reductase [Rhizobium grahamii]EPE99841.1 2-dehydropantoate 2-reductase [Rhizobium grahamii CCGE 502]
MRIAIMGSGAIGGYLGARLALAGHDVTFVARGRHLEAMQTYGLQLESPLGNVSLPHVKATATPGEVGHVDIVFFAVKLYDSGTAAAAIVPMVGPGTRVVTLQNGIDSVETLGRLVPPSQVVGGAAYISGYLKQPGLIVHVGGATHFYVGGHNDAVVGALEAACFQAENIGLQRVEDIDQALWTKFVTLCAFSGATSLIRSGIGSILTDPESHTFLGQLRDEGMAVAKAAGHPMQDGYEAYAASVWQNLPPDTRSSMANDLLNGKPLELAWLSGRMHALGNELGVPTPSHTAVYRALHLYAKGTLNSTADGFSGRETNGDLAKSG